MGWGAAGGAFWNGVHLELNFTQSLFCGLPSVEARGFWAHSNPPATELAFAVPSTHQTHPNQIPAYTQCEDFATCTRQVEVFIWYMTYVPGTLPSGGMRMIWSEEGNEKMQKIEYRLLWLWVCFMFLREDCSGSKGWSTLRVLGCGQGGSRTNLYN